MIALAGPIASEVHTHLPLSSILRTSGAEDAREVGCILDAVPSHERAKFGQNIENAARGMVHKDWAMIQAVAT